MAKNTTLPKAQVNSVTNTTDPTVVFDPTYERTIVTKVWNPQNKDESDATGTNVLTTPEDDTRVDGIEYPIIQINTHMVLREHILAFRLESTGFKPELTLEIQKANYVVGGSPGLVNKITVILIPPVDGTYKKISLDFYITSMVDTGSKLVFDTEFLMPPFEKIHNKAIRVNNTNKLSTYSLLQHIAKECKLGFAATKECKEILDLRPRLAFAESYETIIDKHIKFGGTNENEIFITWVDLYGYLVLCNLTWIINESVEFNSLAIKQMQGLNVTESSAFPENAIKFSKKDTFRILTNQEVRDKKEANVIATYDWEIDNMLVKQHGTNNTYFVFNAVANGGQNNIVTSHVKITDDTIDGKLRPEAYNFENNKFIGVELAIDFSPVLLQEKYRNAFLTKLRKKKLVVTMREPHLGLQRGTLVNLLIYEYDTAGKALLAQNESNLTTDPEDTLDYDSNKRDSAEKSDLIETQTLGTVDMSVSGMYFIDGLIYEYANTYSGLQQTLLLVRKDPDMNYTDFSRPVAANLSQEIKNRDSKQ